MEQVDFSPIEERFGDLSPFQPCPPFWVPLPEQGMPVIDALKQATVRTIGHSAGGRDILALEYGQKEPLDTRTDNLHSAIASTLKPDPTDIFPEAYYGSRWRDKPVVALQGGIHGGEYTGTVASLNLCHIIETGTDLRGKAWPKLQELASGCRLLVIPWLSPDGAARWPLPNPRQVPMDLYQLCSQGIAASGERYRYPAVKAVQPIPPDDTLFMGAYYNDAGVNLQYDFCAIQRQPETTAWMRYYVDERPEGVAIWHCNAGSMIGPPEYYLPEGCQHLISRLGGALRARLMDEGYDVGEAGPAVLPGWGKPFMEQMSAVYHAAGATPVMCELPVGVKEYAYTLDDLLDIGLITIEVILKYAHRNGLRPYHVRDHRLIDQRRAEALAKAEAQAPAQA